MNFIFKSLIKKQMKGVPEEQVDMILALIEKNPAFFQKLMEEIKVKSATGGDQQKITEEVMAGHAEEITGMILNK